MWTTHDDFINVVKNSWSNQVTGNAIQQFIALSNSFKFLPRNWNKNVFGDLFTKIKHNHDQLSLIQSQLMSDPLSDHLRNRNMELTRESYDLHKKEEIFWAQKARANILVTTR